MRPVSVTSGRHPYQVAVHASAIACGVALAIAGRTPKSATEAMPGPVQGLWVVLLISAGIVAIGGAFWRGRAATGLRVELAGVLLLGGGTSMYAVALFAVSGMQATAAGAFLIGIAAASYWRAWQLGRDVRQFTTVQLHLGGGDQ